MAAIVVVSLWTPAMHPNIAARWFSFPNVIIFSPVPMLVIVTATAILRVIQTDTHAAPLALALFPMFLGYSGLAISRLPNIIPPAVSIREAAAPPQAMGFTLVGALFVIPIILGYTSLSYYVFRGKVKSEGYH